MNEETQRESDGRDFLAHYGVLGMKWGVRRSPSELARSAKASAKAHRQSSKDAKAARTRTRFTSGAKDAPANLTDAELKDRISRMDTEKRYNELNARTVSTGQKTVNEIVSSVGKKTVVTAASGALMYAVSKLVEKKMGPGPKPEEAPELHDLVKAVRKGGFKK